MANRRARNAERLGDQEQIPGGLRRLTDVLERLFLQQHEILPVTPVQREVFKAPDFDDKSDVENFIQQFEDEMIFNDWSAGSALLHLRERLKGQAKDCVQEQSVRVIYGILKARFGMTTKEAQTKLAGLRRTCRTTLQEHAMEVERLTNIAYLDLLDYTRQEMAVDTFC